MGQLPAASHCCRAGSTRGHGESFGESEKRKPGLPKSTVSRDYTLLSQRFLCGKGTPIQAFTRSCPGTENEGGADRACYSCCAAGFMWSSLGSPTESPRSSRSFRGPARSPLRGSRALSLSDPSSPYDASATGAFPFPLSAYLRSPLIRKFGKEARSACALERDSWAASPCCPFSCRLNGRLISSPGTGTRRGESAPPSPARRKELPSCACRQWKTAWLHSGGEAGDVVSEERLGGFLPNWAPESKTRQRALSINFPCAGGATPSFSSFAACCRCDCSSSLPSGWAQSCISVPWPARFPCQKENTQGCLRPFSKTEQGGLGGKTEKCCKSAAVRRLWRRRPPSSLFCLLQNAISFCVGALLCFVHFFGGEHNFPQLDLSSVLGAAPGARTPSPGGLLGTPEGSSLSGYRAPRQTRKPGGAGAGSNRLLDVSASDLGVIQTRRAVIRGQHEDVAVRDPRRAGSAEGLQERRPLARLSFGVSGGALSTPFSLARKVLSSARKSPRWSAPIVEFGMGAVSWGTQKDLPRSGEVGQLYSGDRRRSQVQAAQVAAVPSGSRFTLSATESQDWREGLSSSRLRSQELFHQPFAQLHGLPSSSAISYNHSPLLSLMVHDETLQRVVPRRLEAGEPTQEPQPVSRGRHGQRGDTAVSAEKNSVVLSSGWIPRNDGVPTGSPAWPPAPGEGHLAQGIAGYMAIPRGNEGEASKRTTNPRSQVDDVGDGSDFGIDSRANHPVDRVANRFDSGDQTTSTVIWDAQSQEEPERSSEETDDIAGEPEKGAEWASPHGDHRTMRDVSGESVDAQPSAADSHTIRYDSSHSSSGLPEKRANSSSSLPFPLPPEPEHATEHPLRRVSERSALGNVTEASQSGERVTRGAGGPWGAHATEASGSTGDFEQGVSDATDGTGGKRGSWTLLRRVPAKAESGSRTKHSSVTALDQAGQRTASQAATERMWRTRGRLAKLAKMKLSNKTPELKQNKVCKGFPVLCRDIRVHLHSMTDAASRGRISSEDRKAAF